MRDIDIVRTFYERVVAADFPHAGAICDDSSRLKAVSVRGCHGNSKNQLFFSVRLEYGRVVAITYDCQYCDVIHYVTAEIICELARTLTPREIGELRDQDIAGRLGGHVRKVLRQARTSLALLQEGLEGMDA